MNVWLMCLYAKEMYFTKKKEKEQETIQYLPVHQKQFVWLQGTTCWLATSQEFPLGIRTSACLVRFAVS